MRTSVASSCAMRSALVDGDWHLGQDCDESADITKWFT
jgi:hypothetical protein